MELQNLNKKELPNSTAVLVLGILSLVFCWCYGILGLILGIIAVVLAGSQRKLYQLNPEEYTESSYRNLNSGRVCGIVGICISGFVFLYIFLFSLLLGIGASVGMFGIGRHFLDM